MWRWLDWISEVKSWRYIKYAEKFEWREKSSACTMDNQSKQRGRKRKVVWLTLEEDWIWGSFHNAGRLATPLGSLIWSFMALDYIPLHKFVSVWWQAWLFLLKKRVHPVWDCRDSSTASIRNWLLLRCKAGSVSLRKLGSSGAEICHTNVAESRKHTFPLALRKQKRSPKFFPAMTKSLFKDHAHIAMEGH